MRALAAASLGLFLLACGDDTAPVCDACPEGDVCIADGICGPPEGDPTGGSSAAGIGATAAVSSGAGASGAGATSGGGPMVGCHATGDCACYEPPYHPSEIDCAAACASASAICAGDPSCWACTYYQSQQQCLDSCAGIAATWTQPNVATYLADVVWGCADENTSCAGMTACSDGFTAQQETVCP